MKNIIRFLVIGAFALLGLSSLTAASLQPGWAIVPSSSVLATQGGFNSAVSFRVFQRQYTNSTVMARWWNTTDPTDNPNLRKEDSDTFPAPMFHGIDSWFFGTFDYRIVDDMVYIKPTDYGETVLQTGVWDGEEAAYPIHDYLDSRSVLNLKAITAGSMVSIEGYVQGEWDTLARIGEGYSIIIVGPRPSEIRGKFGIGAPYMGSNEEGIRITPNILAGNCNPKTVPFLPVPPPPSTQ
jgi:hypothetical protein